MDARERLLGLCLCRVGHCEREHANSVRVKVCYRFGGDTVFHATP